MQKILASTETGFTLCIFCCSVFVKVSLCKFQPFLFSECADAFTRHALLIVVSIEASFRADLPLSVAFRAGVCFACTLTVFAWLLCYCAKWRNWKPLFRLTHKS